MSKLVLNLAVDVSGQPTEDIYVGLISIKTDQIRKITKLFKREFPEIYGSKHRKGTKLSDKELLKIIEFFDRNYIFMYNNHFSQKEWFEWKKKYNNPSYFYEKIYALLYFGIIHKAVHKQHPQNLIIDKENYLDIDKTLGYLDYLAKSNGYTLILSIGYSSSSDLIKFADLIAAAGRKVNRNVLKKFPRFQLLELKDLHFKFIERIFKK